MPIKIAFRVDASSEIGTGHVMRCLTLAEALRAKGRAITFVCTGGPGNLADLIRSNGFDLIELAVSGPASPEPRLAHSHWLRGQWEDDADQTRAELLRIEADFLIVDHYALDRAWEERVGLGPARTVVIDDLADREHACGLLVDANLGRASSDYTGLVPLRARVVAGAEYALLRPEFPRLRTASLKRRAVPRLGSILIAMGGVDAPNATGRVLGAMREAVLGRDVKITVVLGSNAKWLAEVRNDAATMPWATEVLVGVTTMAEVMTASDLAIGGAGVTAWERCCLGLPTVIVTIAGNQIPGALALHRAGAGHMLGGVDAIGTDLAAALERMSEPALLGAMGIAASAVSDGAGAGRVVSLIEGLH